MINAWEADVCVHKHMQRTAGYLRQWGAIRRYLFFYGPGLCLKISLTGRLVGERPDFVVPGPFEMSSFRRTRRCLGFMV